MKLLVYKYGSKMKMFKQEQKLIKEFKLNPLRVVNNILMGLNILFVVAEIVLSFNSDYDVNVFFLAHVRIVGLIIEKLPFMGWIFLLIFLSFLPFLALTSSYKVCVLGERTDLYLFGFFTIMLVCILQVSISCLIGNMFPIMLYLLGFLVVLYAFLKDLNFYKKREKGDKELIN